MSDQQQQFAEMVRHAYDNHMQLSIKGNGSKDFLRTQDNGEPLDTLANQGIIAYEPSELVVTARSGTAVADLQHTLAQHQQTLAFDPPCFGNQGSIGGAIATGLSGPSRPWTGAARDHVLGVRIINGKGEILEFGGQVMKNVAGYDVSRLMTGAYGTLGLLLDISIKVLPLPERTLTVNLECSAERAIEYMNQLSAKSVPLTGACWLDNQLYLRLSGTHAGVDAACDKIGGDKIDNSEFWQTLRDHQLDFFEDSYWRISLPPASGMLPLQGQWLIDWGGAQRWLRTEAAPEHVLATAVAAGGYAEQWKTTDKRWLRTALDPAIHKYHQRLKAAFDPGHVFNMGVMYTDL